MPGSFYSNRLREEKQQDSGGEPLVFEDTRSDSRGTRRDSAERREGENRNEAAGTVSRMEETAQMRLLRLQRPNPQQDGFLNASPG